MKLYIIGYMGAGKSRFGETLAGILNYAFIDLDELFENRHHIMITDFFDKYGEEVFRNIESRLLHETASFTNTVISTGGGTPCFSDNMDFMLKEGICIYLKQDTQTLISRVSGLKRKRPLLRDVNNDDLEDYINQHLAGREPFYLRANLILEGEDTKPEQAVSILRSGNFLK